MNAYFCWFVSQWVFALLKKCCSHKDARSPRTPHPTSTPRHTEANRTFQSNANDKEKRPVNGAHRSPPGRWGFDKAPE